MPSTTSKLSSVMPEIVLKTINGTIFFLDLDQYFQTQKDTLSVIPGRTSADILADEDTLDYIKLIINNFIDTVSGREDKPFLDGGNPINATTEDGVIKIICHIYESEISLFDEKKSHYEKQSIIKDIQDQSALLITGISILGYSNTALTAALKLFSEYINFIINKSKTSFDVEINNEFNTCAYSQPYLALVKIDQALDPKSKNISTGKTHTKKDFKELVARYYTHSIGTDLVNKSNGSQLPSTTITFTDLYIFFGYIKNYEYDESEHLEAYNKMYLVFKEFSKNNQPNSGNKIKDRIIKTNTIFLLNYLISGLASAFKKDKLIKKNPPDKIEKYKTTIEDLVIKNQDEEEHSYFTYYKLGRLYLGIGEYYLYRGEFEKARYHVQMAKDKLKEARKRFNLPGGSLLRFYPDFTLLSDSNIFSLSGFCRMHGSDFSARIFSMEFDIVEFLNDMAFKQSMIKIEKSEKRAEEAEKSASKHNIEILSIFAAIVMFVSGNIQIFQYITSVKLAIIFMIGFAFSLFIFVLLLRFNFRFRIGTEDSMTIKIVYHILNFIILLGFLSVLIGGAYILYKADDSELKNEKYIDHVKEEVKKDLESKENTKNVNPYVENKVINYNNTGSISDN